jgi:hypothetical protein
VIRGKRRRSGLGSDAGMGVPGQREIMKNLQMVLPAIADQVL